MHLINTFNKVIITIKTVSPKMMIPETDNVTRKVSNLYI